MTTQQPRITAALLSLLTSLSAFAAFALATPVAAQNVPTSVRDRIAEACVASDADLVGKRLASECRIALQAQAKAGHQQLSWSTKGRTVVLVASR